MAYRALNRELVSKWVAELIRKKGSPKQIELLKQIRDNNNREFVTFIERSLAGEPPTSPYDSGDDSPTLVLPRSSEIALELGPQHMYLMPTKDIVKLYNHWNHIAEVDASDFAFWGATTLSEIRSGRIKPAWLAVRRSWDELRAIRELDRVIQLNHDANGSNKEHTKAIDKAADTLVRRVLRWMMGPGNMRGAAELYGNCSLAKAWWCGHLAMRCVDHLKSAPHPDATLSFEDAVASLRAVWLEMADYISGKLTVIGEPNSICAIALWSHQHLCGSGRTSHGTAIPRKKVRQILHGLGEMSSWCVLGAKPPAEIREIIETVYRSPVENGSDDS